MKYTCKKILALLLAVLCMLATVGCRKSDSIKEGITVEANAPYSAETMAYAKQTVLSLVKYAYTSVSPLNSVTAKVEARLAGYADRVCAITAQKPLTEAQYRSMLDTLAREGERAVDELLALRAGESTECGTVRRLYLDLTSVFGSEYVASMLYDICSFIYDAKYELKLERYEETQYPWYKEEADAIAAEKAIFLTSVEKTAFSALIRCGSAAFELFSNGFESFPDAFSDEELLQIVKALDLEEIVIDQAGWSLLISYLLPKEEEVEASYLTKLRYAFRASGDCEKVAEVMDEAMCLAVSVTENLLPEDIGALREENYEALANSVFSRFSEQDWELFSTVTAVNLSNGQYSDLALAEYGDAYSEYHASLHENALSFEALRQSLGMEDFYSNLLNYLAGICPAVSYEVNK